MMLFGFVALPRRRSEIGFRTKLFLIPLFFVALVMSACGGGSGPRTNPNGTPAGTFNISVEATSGSVTGSASLVLTVQ